MKFTILRKSLIKGLNLVERITGRNLVLPILNNVLLSTEKNFLKLVTTDLEIAIIHRCLAKIEKEGEITIPVKILNNFVSFIEDQKINIELKNKNLFIAGENYKTQIKGLNPKEFPIIPKIEENEWLESKSLPFCQGLTQVIDFCSITQTRPELSGVYFSFDEKQLRIVATDSFRLAEKILHLEESQNSFSGKSLILPRNAAKEVINMFSDTSGKIKIYLSPNQIMFESRFSEIDSPQSQIVSRLIEGEFPEYREIIPKAYKTHLVLDRDRFQNGIKSVSLFSGRGNELKLKVDPKGKTVEVSAQDSEIGETNVTIPAKIEGEKVGVCFNHKFLLDGVGKIKAKEIILELNGEGGAGVIKSSRDQDFLYVLMPIKSNPA